ncbi:hypothetical protein JVT61DRAFT_7262 [Boletus reticuloceps]|uniref:Uncharacterized protein n=1 Tax=Boletus reticuloceps TaxID=495285 RepID=A0A8I2YKD1_9AGAM|nr:hypothetical protein JVT61DRAFT_7262 [Boletus reticuloceps]
MDELEVWIAQWEKAVEGLMLMSLAIAPLCLYVVQIPVLTRIHLLCDQPCAIPHFTLKDATIPFWQISRVFKGYANGFAL